MKQIVLGTTPTILFEFNTVDPGDIVLAEMTIKDREILLLKDIDEAVISGKQMSWKLTQQETISLGIGTYKLMCNWLLADGTRGVSKEEAVQVLSNHVEDVMEGGTTPDIVVPVTPTIQDEPLAGESFVTPQQFGARGNGYTDDTDAVQAALDAGGSVYMSKGEYLISRPLVINNKKFWSLNAQDAIITYSGTGYAVRILNATHCRIDIGYVNAINGGGIEFYSDSKNSWTQYVTLIFNCISAASDCIHVETYDDGWSNENHVYGGRFAAGENGVNIIPHGINGLSGWKFYNCGIEGVKNGFRLDATAVDYICNMVFENSRYGEDFETILKTIGTVFDCAWNAPSHIMPAYISCSENTNRFAIAAPIGTYWHLHDTAYYRGYIMGGRLMGERPTLTEVT